MFELCFFFFFSYISNCNTDPTDTVSKETAGITQPFYYLSPMFSDTSDTESLLFGLALTVLVTEDAPDFLRVRINPIECFAGTP